ncbi:hypothetical protein [Psychroflexus sediminis]|uniref:Sensor of ECF-type sigma factor n=1 Tax=Psychroflexus sediminis TaxID=470826 RepID=A0A1G7WW90_9FLAO|nr:hypothetical protein [Psychroflexus sediminis]SDG76208.1 hypothetical protein SAMN04488027_106173 [Psychroflexus sediminis]
MTKKTIFLILFTFIFSFYAKAQDAKDDKIEQLKIAFFTKELNLTASEAKRFWPVYNDHNTRYENLRSTEWNQIKSRLNNVKDLNPAEAERLLNDYMAYKQARVDYRVDFVNDLKEVISAKQIMMLKKAEYDFHKKLLKQYRSDKSSKD